MVEMQALLEQCAAQVAPALMNAVVQVESAWNPFAIGMDAPQGPVKQPSTLAEAVATARVLESSGRKFSVGLAQIHVSNVDRHGMTWEQAFDPCQNLATGQSILWSFHRRATAAGYSGSAALGAALRGYNAGAIDRSAGNGYVQKVLSKIQVRQPLGSDVLDNLPASAKEPAPGRSRAPPRTGESLEIFEKQSRPSGF